MRGKYKCLLVSNLILGHNEKGRSLHKPIQ